MASLSEHLARLARSASDDGAAAPAAPERRREGLSDVRRSGTRATAAIVAAKQPTMSATKPRGETLTPPHSSSTRSEADVVPSSSVSTSSREAERERTDRDARRAHRGV